VVGEGVGEGVATPSKARKTAARRRNAIEFVARMVTREQREKSGAVAFNIATTH